jgi:D-sedoheptulose 7-phosphate isomerase
MNIEERLNLRAELIKSNSQIFISTIEDITNIFTKSLKENHKLMFCGNGGSAAESQHMAAEYCATLNHKNFRNGFSAMSLTVDTSFITAWSNDFGYTDVFSRQVETLGKDGDVLICYSTSGTSKNILAAISKAKSLNIKVVLFTGNNQNITIKKDCDYIFYAPSSNTALIQELHTIIGHEVCLNVERMLEKK